jgi:acyl carrier protein
MPDLDENVMDFVAEFTGVKRQRLTLASTLLGDLGIDGADGWELVKGFGQKFQVDLSAFRADRHFGPEGLPIYAPFILLWWLISWPFRKKQSPEERAGLTAIRVSDLITAAREKRWTL